MFFNLKFQVAVGFGSCKYFETGAWRYGIQNYDYSCSEFLPN
jgi:hypothetical protein